MATDKLFVSDTNVLIDALMFARSFGRRAFDLAQRQGTIVHSKHTFAELAEVIYRPKFDRFITDHEREVFLRFVGREFLLRDITQSITACRDPKDDKFLELAVSAKADLILSRDQDLLVLSPFQEIVIMQPQAFVEHS